MLLTPGITAENCPNKKKCGTIVKCTDEEIIELRIAKIQLGKRIVERVRQNPRWFAKRLLNDRGCPQTYESLGLDVSIDSLDDVIDRCEDKLLELFVGYVAPQGVTALRYSVKRPYGTYQYNKLASDEPLFPAQYEDGRVKVFHLSHDGDHRNILARSGIERRKRILHLKTQIEFAKNLLQRTLDEFDRVSIDDVVAEKTII
jgi:hypothetical protein